MQTIRWKTPRTVDDEISDVASVRTIGVPARQRAESIARTGGGASVSHPGGDGSDLRTGLRYA